MSAEPGFETDISNRIEPASAERRGFERIRTVYRVAQISTLTNKGLCLVHNLSSGGAMVETELALSRSDNVKLALTEGAFVRGRVAWRGGTQVGVRFLSPIDCCAVLHATAQDRWAGKSRPPRLAIYNRATLKSPAGSIGVTIRDISQRGIKVGFPGELLVGQALDITLAGGFDVRGIVRWANGGTAGVQLSEMLTIEQLGDIERLKNRT